MILPQIYNFLTQTYDESIVKLSMITVLIILVYFLRKIAYVALEKRILKILKNKSYIQDILDLIKQPTSNLLLFINLNLVLYVYYNFNNPKEIVIIFNMIYTLFLSFLFYRTINSIARVKISSIDIDKNNIKTEVINLGIKILNFILILFGILLSLHFAGLDLTTILSGLGIGGFAVALAAKDSLANFFGTLSILFGDIFSQGDWISIGEKEGTVVEIGLRVTTLRGFDNSLIAIPNSVLANNDIKNYNRRTLGRRIKMKLGIKYNSKAKDIQNAIKEIRIMLDKHPKIATINTKHNYEKTTSAKLVSKDDLQGIKRNLLVFLDEFSDSSIDILIYCFAKTVAWNEWLETKEDVMYKIMEIFESNNLEFAFPSVSLYQED